MIGMRMELQGPSSVWAEGSLILELPEHVVILPQSELDDIAHLRSPVLRGRIIIAAGRASDDADITLVLATGEIRAMPGQSLPLGPVRLTEYGHSLAYGPEYGLEASSEWCIANSKPCLLTGNEDHGQGTTQVDP